MGAEAGTFLLLAVTYLLEVPLPGSLALKAGMLLAANLTITLFFALDPGMLDPRLVIPLALGVSGGGWIGARLACLPGAKDWCYRFILTCMIGELLLMLWRQFGTLL